MRISLRTFTPFFGIFMNFFSLAATTPSKLAQQYPILTRFRDDVYRRCCDTSPHHNNIPVLFLNTEVISLAAVTQAPTVMGFIMGNTGPSLSPSETISTHHPPLSSFRFLQTNNQHQYHLPSRSTARNILSCHRAPFLSLPRPHPSLTTISSLPSHRSICQTHRPLPSCSRHLPSPRPARHLRLPRPRPHPRLAQCRKPLQQTQCQAHR